MDVVITNHAVGQYVSRVKKMGGSKPRDPRGDISQLLKRSVLDESLDKATRVKRMMTHGFKDATYRACDGWRFIIIENKVVTSERIKHWQN